MRAPDTYGSYQAGPWKDSDPFVLTKERKAEIPDRRPGRRHHLPRQGLYNAIAVLIEKECKLLAVPWCISPMKASGGADYRRQTGGGGQDPARRPSLRLRQPVQDEDEGDKILGVALSVSAAPRRCRPVGEAP